jgi:hypothetical protein
MEVFLFYQMGKKQGNKKRESKKRVVSVRGNEGTFVCSCVLLRFGNALRLTAFECPSLRRNTVALETPLQFYGFFGWVFFLCVLKETGRECTPFVAKLNPFVCKFFLMCFEEK